MTYNEYKKQTIEQKIAAQVQTQLQMEAARLAQLRALTEGETHE